MHTMLSQRVKQISPSMTMAVSAKAAELKAAGEDIISFGAGEPDFATPLHICEAAYQAMKDEITHYTQVGGLPQLKESIIAKFQRENNLAYTADEIVVSCGAKHSIYNLCQVLLNPGDEAIIPAPYWVSYPDITKLAEGVPVIVECDVEQDFKITAEDLEKAISPKTKLLFLNSPSNPTGRIYSPKELEQLAQVLRKYPNVHVMSDDIYEHLCYTEADFQNILNVAPDLKDRCTIVNGVSKAYAMTGWRIGYCASSKEIIGAMQKLQGQCTSNPPSISQMAAVAALDGGLECVQEMRSIFQQRNQVMSERLLQIDGIHTSPAQGAFYQFVDIREAMKTIGIENDIEYAKHLIEKEKVAIVPGTSFGLNGYMRLSFAIATDRIEEGIERIRKFHS